MVLCCACVPALWAACLHICQNIYAAEAKASYQLWLVVSNVLGCQALAAFGRQSASKQDRQEFASVHQLNKLAS